MDNPGNGSGLSRCQCKAVRKRTDLEVSIWPWAALNPDVKQGTNDARPPIAFYARIRQNESFFEAHGFGEEARKCQEEVSEYLTAAEQVPMKWFRRSLLWMILTRCESDWSPSGLSQTAGAWCHPLIA